ncbi:hypothetical protein F7734_30880 [Scytonema sp. UIC 10036]|uniref:hypothetical protein n=1 Tax=Scytonema sp. UIC 10036 TaxID=2304196 RepID=UPI0012DAED9C|nr:hypothetical protein [Scytonema sp. UIC 10036]MUG96507.1 hypothetical protein [Scytonema sp. UIC 10036]
MEVNYNSSYESRVYPHTKLQALESPVVFRVGEAHRRYRILKGIEETAEDVWTWLAEWQRLRELIAQ